MTQNEFERIWKDSSDTVTCHTSGSTGKPKEIRLDKQFMRQSAERTNDFFGINGNSRLHTCLDFSFIASMMMVVRADVAGCLLTSESPSSHPLGGIGKDEAIDLVSVVPTQMKGILEASEKWSGIRNFLIGGAPVPLMLRRQIELSGYQAWESYGMTETASHIALRKVSESIVPFETLPGITVSANEEGCLVVHLPGRRPLATTDLADVISPKEFLILGRADHCVISGGIKIIPEDLERQLGPFIAFNYCISSVPDNKWGERLVIVVETGNSDLDDDLLKDAVGVRLRQYRKLLNLGVKSPKEVVSMRSLPKTANGKIDRKAVKETLARSAVL